MPSGAFSVARSAIWRFTEAVRKLPTRANTLMSDIVVFLSRFEFILACTNRTVVRFIPAGLESSMVAAHQPLPLSGQTTQERGDAARNRELLLDSARRLIAKRGPDSVTMDDIASEAGVGKGTLFRRFGNRAGLMMVLLSEDDRKLQQAFMFGPPPLGPAAPPLDRLLAYGRARRNFVDEHRDLLKDAARDPQTRYSAVAMLHRTHV